MAALSVDPAVLQVSGLTKSYREGSNDREVLRGVSFDIRQGELVVLLGRSGSGKSTLLNLISGMDTPTAGRIAYGGVDLTTLSDEDRTVFRRESIGLIFQSFNLIPTLTVEENVLLPLDLTGGLTLGRRQEALAFLDHVGLSGRGSSFPDRLSGGEQQRVAIARALAHEPTLILADEPTGNLDFRTAEVVMDVLEKQVHDRERTMLIATHDKDIISLADRVFMLHEGLIKEMSPSEAMSPSS